MGQMEIGNVNGEGRETLGGAVGMGKEHDGSRLSEIEIFNDFIPPCYIYLTKRNKRRGSFSLYITSPWQAVELAKDRQVSVGNGKRDEMTYNQKLEMAFADRAEMLCRTIGNVEIATWRAPNHG